MSFILDALKKSELERQRQTTPGLVESGIARPRSRLPVWAIALGALLAVNLVVLAVVLTRGLPAPAPPLPATARDRPPEAAAGGTGSAPVDSAEYAPEIPGADLAAVGTPATGVPAGGAPAGDSSVAPRRNSWKPAREEAASGGAPAARRREPVLADDDYKPGEESLPTINEITQTLPELHLDVHVYATRPAERFVFINMRKYHEGATLQEGPTIEHIRRDGVVMDYQGLKFLLPRQ